MARESAETKAALEWLNSHSEVFAWKAHGDMFSISGIPDIVGVWAGRFFAIEMKQPGKEATPIQQHRMRQIAEAGGFTFVAYSANEVQIHMEDWASKPSAYFPPANSVAD